MVGIPELTIFSKQINFSAPSFDITIHSNFTFNHIYDVVNFLIVIISRGIKYNFDINTTKTQNDYKNYASIHDRSVNGKFTFSVPYDWKNETLLVLVNASINGKYFVYESDPIIIDYQTMFKGSLICKKL